MDLIYLNIAVVKQLIDSQSKKENSLAACRDEEGLVALLNEVQNEVLYPDLADKMARLIVMMCRNHYFLDFNKRAAILVGALFLHVNGYEGFLSRYFEIQKDYIIHVIKGTIGQLLLADMMRSMLNGDEEFEEVLKFRILMAIDKGLKEEDPIELSFVKSVSADNHNKEKVQYPFFCLVLKEDVIEIEQKTCFELRYYLLEDHFESLGLVKIMHKDGDTYNNMEVSFNRLNDKFCSLGLGNEYYMNLLYKFGYRHASAILRALRDAGTNDEVYEKFCSHPIFINSLLKDLSSQNARQEASLLMDGSKMNDVFSFAYRHVPIYNMSTHIDWELDIKYDCLPFQRTFAIIGENGVGKTQIMSQLMHDIVESDCPNLTNSPLFGGVLAICSSHYDAYSEQKEKITNPRIPVNVCTVVQDKDTKKRLHEAIKQIISRGTYYTGQEVLSLREHYMELLTIQLGKDMATDLILSNVDAEGEERFVVNEKKLENLVKTVSTGELQIFELITFVCTHVHLKTLMLIDEPEVHLHPRLITRFFVALSGLLSRFKSYAIISTHSPVVIRECVNQNVYRMCRDGKKVALGKVRYATFGEDLSVLYQRVFDFDERESYFYDVVKDRCNANGGVYKDVISFMEASKIKLGLNSRDMIRDCIDDITSERV